MITDDAKYVFNHCWIK